MPMRSGMRRPCLGLSRLGEVDPVCTISSAIMGAMTSLVEKAIGEIGKLPPEQQDAIASRILDEIADDARWDKTFAESQDELARLARAAREDARAGRVEEGGFDDL